MIRIKLLNVYCNTFFCFLFSDAPLSFALSFPLIFGNIHFKIHHGHFATARSYESVPYAQVANADSPFQFISQVLRHLHHDFVGSFFFLLAILLHSLTYTYGHCAFVPCCLPLPLYASLSANSASTSPWQASGLHQQPSVFPLSSVRICLINEVLARIQILYLQITSCLEPSVPILNGLPHFDGLPI